MEQIKYKFTIRDAIDRIGLHTQTQRGRLVANCPFHAGDNTPSLIIYEEQHRFFCFGCHASGDQVDMMARFWGCDTRQAVKELARELGVSQGKRDPEAERQAREKLEENRRRLEQRERLEATFTHEFLLLAAVERACYGAFFNYQRNHDDPEAIRQFEAAVNLIGDVVPMLDQMHYGPERLAAMTAAQRWWGR
ncbi:CHC2 zinc finger domain-containing protein [Heliobacterium chlorum]|uniref:CHC2 zinc finger domain-containing protein n=1 Tax=Heliobacterium chlorum TaxID=2698 RepID=UPI00311AA3D4